MQQWKNCTKVSLYRRSFKADFLSLGMISAHKNVSQPDRMLICLLKRKNGEKRKLENVDK